MFDKLIESNSEQAEFKPRRKFFMVSSVVVGILFITAVVASLYAQDLDLGTDNFELVDMIAPPDADVPKPEPPRQQQQQNRNQQSDLPVRNNLIARVDQPQDVPDTISTTRNTQPTIPVGRFIYNPNGVNSDGNGVETGPSTAVTGGTSSDVEPVAEIVKETAPPPVAKAEPKVPRVKSEGVVNGKATYLPVPAYPPTAKMVGAAGIVNVQVTIDEEGNVISSKAINGHPLLKQTAENAAWKARFTPTLLSKVPVKVTGIIVFNFKRS